MNDGLELEMKKQELVNMERHISLIKASVHLILLEAIELMEALRDAE